jgi:hypothetical protein
MRSHLSKFILVLLTVSLSACAAIQAQRQAQVAKQQEFQQHVDIAHIWVTEGDAPAGKPYTKLGDIKYTQHINPEDIADAIDAHKMNEKLKAMANAKYPDQVDAIIHTHSDVSNDGTLVTVSAEAIQYESSADREAMHHMNEGIVASPSGD